jgi:hypothetical protein
MTQNDDVRLRAFFRELHEGPGTAVPDFASLARPVAPRRDGALIGRALALALAAGAVLLMVRAWPGRSPADDEALRLASALGRWEAPTDFLLKTPGVEFLRSSPRFGLATESMSGDSTDLLQEEVSR